MSALVQSLLAQRATSAQDVAYHKAQLREALRKEGKGASARFPKVSQGLHQALNAVPATQIYRERMEATVEQRRAEYDENVLSIKERRTRNRASVASVASEEARSAGLVSCSTTLTSDNSIAREDHYGVPMYAGGKIEIETAKARIRKMSRAVMKTTDIHRTAQQVEFEGRRSATIMATLTYAKHQQPEAEDVTKCLRNAAVWFSRKYKNIPKAKRPKLRFTWVAELTKKGKLHYHVLFFLPPMVKLPMFDVRGWWPKGSTRLEWARCAHSYMAKYASKGSTGRGAMPKGFRMHGSGGMTKDERNERRYHLAPSWVREFFKLEDRPRACPGGGWISPVTGEAWESPYEILTAAAGRVTVRIRSWFIDSTPNFNLEQFA